MNVLIIGQGAIGQACARKILHQGHQVTAVSRHQDVTPSGITPISIPDWNWESMTKIIDSLNTLPDRLIVTTGMLWTEHQSPEKRLEDLSAQALQDSFSANALLPMACLAALSGRLKRSSALHALVVTAKVGSIADNRLGGWYAYRASKAACHMLLRTTAIEWQRRFPDCALGAYHPGTTDSPLSEPFQSRVPDTQLKSPDDTADCLWQVLSEQIHPEQTGRFWNWDGTELPW